MLNKETRKEERQDRISKENAWEISLAYKPLIIKSIKTYYNKPQEFEDLIQEGHIKIVEVLEDFDSSKGSLGAYLKTQLKYFYLSKNKIKEDLSLDGDGEGSILETLASPDNTEEDFLMAESLKDLRESIDSLTAIEKEVIVSHYFEGTSLTDLAKSKGRSKASISQAKKRALEKLRKKTE